MAFKPFRSLSGSTSVLLLYLLLLERIIQSSGLTISFCSSQNTGSGFGPTYNQYQSNGACQDTCQKSFAYAVLQGNNCWCSNYAPADQTDTGSCNSQCPGFTEQCGNPGAGLFGYYQLGNVQPSGTAGAAAASSTSSPAAASSSPQESPPPPSIVTVQATVTNKPNPSVSISVVVSTVPQSSSNSPAPASPTSSSPPTTSSPPQQASQPAWTPTPSAVVTTVLGSIQTVIITPTIPPATAQTQVTTVNGTAMPDSFWSNTGKVAGTFTAVGIVVAALIGGLVWFVVRRTRSRDSMAIRSTSDGDNTSVTQMPFGAEKRNSKLTLATAGLGGVGRGDSHEKSTAENTPASMSRRASIPLSHDQRLDPHALYNLQNANESHVSVGSFRDDRDYSRPVLHVRNPD